MSNMIVRVRKKYSGYRIKRKKKTGLIFSRPMVLKQENEKDIWRIRILVRGMS